MTKRKLTNKEKAELTTELEKAKRMQAMLTDTYNVLWEAGESGSISESTVKLALANFNIVTGTLGLPSVNLHSNMLPQLCEIQMAFPGFSERIKNTIRSAERILSGDAVEVHTV